MGSSEIIYSSLNELMAESQVGVLGNALSSSHLVSKFEHCDDIISKDR